MARGRVLCEAATAKEFKEICETLRIKPAYLLEYFFKEHSACVTEDSVKAYAYLEELNLSEMVSFSVSSWCQLWIKDMGISYHTRMHVITTIILQDNMATLKINPSLYPWINEQILRGSSASAARMKPPTAVISIKKSLHKRIKNYIQAIAEDSKDRLSILNYIEHTLQGFPEREFIRAAERLTTDAGILIAGKHKKEDLTSIRIPRDLSDFITEISNITGAPKGSIIEYILEKNLNAAEEEMTVDRQLLPENLRERWVVLMRELIEYEKQEDIF